MCVCVFNVPSWTCLSVYVWTKIGQCLEDSSTHCPVEHLIMIFICFVEREGGGDGVLGVLINGNEKEHIVILCWEHIGNQRKMKRNPPPTPRPLLPWAFHWLHEISIPKRIHHRLKPEWEMRRTGWGDRRGALCTGFTLVNMNHYRSLSSCKNLKPQNDDEQSQELKLYSKQWCKTICTQDIS